MTDPGDRLLVHTDMNELLQPAFRPDYPQRSVACVDQLTRCFDDASQDHRQGEVAHDRLVRAQQPTHPVLRRHHIMGAIHELAQQLIQLQQRRSREHNVRGAAIIPGLTRTRYRHSTRHYRLPRPFRSPLRLLDTPTSSFTPDRDVAGAQVAGGRPPSQIEVQLGLGVFD
jgi:hypothetical protein